MTLAILANSTSIEPTTTAQIMIQIIETSCLLTVVFTDQDKQFTLKELLQKLETKKQKFQLMRLQKSD